MGNDLQPRRRDPLAWLSAPSRWFGWAGGALILACAFLIAIDVATRKALGIVWLESYEISTYIFAVSCAFGYAWALVAGAHIRVDVLHAKLPRPGRAALDVIAIAALVVVSATLAWHAWETVLASAGMHARSNSALGVPLVWPQGLWAIGLSWFALACISIAARLAWLLVARRPAEAEDLIHGRAIAENDAEHLIAPPSGERAR